MAAVTAKPNFFAQVGGVLKSVVNSPVVQALGSTFAPGLTATVTKGVNAIVKDTETSTIQAPAKAPTLATSAQSKTPAPSVVKKTYSDDTQKLLGRRSLAAQ